MPVGGLFGLFTGLRRLTLNAGGTISTLGPGLSEKRQLVEYIARTQTSKGVLSLPLPLTVDSVV